MPLRLHIGGFSKFLVLIGMGQPLNIKCQGMNKNTMETI